MSVRLEWDGKPTHVERLSLPFQTVETINQSRATRGRNRGSLFVDERSREQESRNLLVWGDNKLVMSSLLREYAGRIKLIYIDPPFATGDDFSIRVSVGDDGLVKAPTILEEHAYRDTWGRGYESYLSTMYSRLTLMHELLSEDGALYVHAGTTVSHLLRSLCDDVFGAESFRNEIVWKRFNFHADAGRFGRVTDRILFYSRSAEFSFNEVRAPFSEEYVADKFTHVDEDGRRFRLSDLNPPAGRGPIYEFHGITKPWQEPRVVCRYGAIRRAH